MTVRDILGNIPDSYAQLVLDIAAKRDQAETDKPRPSAQGDKSESSHTVAPSPPRTNALSR